jgi:cell surface protein SprA
VVNTNAKPQVQNNEFIDGLMGVLTSVKNIQVNYTDSGTVLPGYTPSVGFLGSSRPSLGFTFGSQDDVRYEAAKNGWLTIIKSSIKILLRLPIRCLRQPQMWICFRI